MADGRKAQTAVFLGNDHAEKALIFKKIPDRGRKIAVLVNPPVVDHPAQFLDRAVEEGALVYRRTGCAGCHGVAGIDGRAPRLVKRDAEPGTDPWNLGRILPIRAPYATVVWDYINRGMPLNREGTLTADQVYALTAYLLFLNEVIPEDAVMDAQSLPQVEMPNRDAWAALPDWKPGMPRLPGYPY